MHYIFLTVININGVLLRRRLVFESYILCCLCYIFVTFVEIVIIQVHKVVVELWNRPLFIEAWILFIYFFRINGL